MISSGTSVMVHIFRYVVLVFNKDCEKYTRDEPERNEKSITDYIITEKTDRRMIQDIRVNRGAKLSTDHYSLAPKT